MDINPDGPSKCRTKSALVYLHELGHVLGLRDANSDSCGPQQGRDGSIMWFNSVDWPSGNFVVTPETCAAVDEARSPPDDDRGDGGDDGGGDPPPTDGDGDEPPGGVGPGRGDDPISVCTEDPDLCVEPQWVCTRVIVTDSEGQQDYGWECGFVL